MDETSGATTTLVEPDRIARLEQLASDIIDASGQIHAAEAQLASLLAELHALEGWGGVGYRSMAHWLSVRGGFSLPAARRRCIVAEAVPEMPTVMEHAAEGRISASMLASLSRVATPENEARLAEVCVTVSPSQAQRVIGACEQIRAADKKDEGGEPATWHRSYWDDAGRLRINAALGAEDGAMWLSANAAARASADRAARAEAGETDDADESTEPDLVETSRTDQRPQITDIEALRHLAELAVDQAERVGLTDRGSERFCVLISADLADLASSTTSTSGAHTETCRVLDGPSIAAEAVRRLACDCKVQAVLHDARHGLAMGRELRVVNRHQRRALRIRDRGCRFPGCGQTRWVDAHHIIHWTNGGLTDLDNLILVCRAHHHALHEGGWTITGTATSGLTFHDPRGQTVGRPQVHAPPGRVDFELVPEAATSAGAGEPLSRFGAGALVEYLLPA